MKILLAIDDSKFSEAAIQRALFAVQPEHSEACIFHVVEPLLMIPHSCVALRIWRRLGQQLEGKELVERTGQQLSKAGFKVHTVLERGIHESQL